MNSLATLHRARLAGLIANASSIGRKMCCWRCTNEKWNTKRKRSW